VAKGIPVEFAHEEQQRISLLHDSFRPPGGMLKVLEIRSILKAVPPHKFKPVTNEEAPLHCSVGNSKLNWTYTSQ
jgi:hypothetical protein